MTPAVELAPVTSTDLDDVHRLFSDAATWQHLPSGRHADLAATSAMVEAIEREWAEVGLSLSTVRAYEPWDGVVVGDVVGVAGVSPRDGAWWNVGYRFAPAAWGRGLAVSTTAEAISRAHALRPGWPVISRLLSSNPASERVSRSLGLGERWRGRAAAAPGVNRLILADRELEATLLQSVIGLG